MPVTLICPSLKCRKVLQVPDITRGKSVRCSHCGASFLVPDKKKATATAGAGARAVTENKPDEKTV
jgi:LSD1 subclass zinc finger protein